MEKKCPECGSKMVKAGFARKSRTQPKVQVYICTKCGRRTMRE